MQTNNKQREALGKILWCLEWMFNNTDDKSVQSHLIEPISLAKAALAEPVRNCDVGTAKEQVKRWRRFCNSMTTCGECPCHKSYSEVVADCFSRWAQMPYVEKGGAE